MLLVSLQASTKKLHENAHKIQVDAHKLQVHVQTLQVCMYAQTFDGPSQEVKEGAHRLSLFIFLKSMHISSFMLPSQSVGRSISSSNAGSHLLYLLNKFVKNGSICP